ncbi:hypothetical protein C9J85_10915 [Haloferax sp. wsp5]|nr:hypothetical protein C9J85_10915 [Haloferax sp. wsp5]
MRCPRASARRCEHADKRVDCETARGDRPGGDGGEAERLAERQAERSGAENEDEAGEDDERENRGRDGLSNRAGPLGLCPDLRSEPNERRR